MFQIDNATAAAAEPTRGAAGVKVDAFFQDLSSGGTIVTADIMNAIMKELGNIVTSKGGTLDKADDTQVAAFLKFHATRNIAQTVKTDTESLATTGAWTDIPGMSVTITPALATSKILINFSACGSNDGGGFGVALRLLRDSTEIGSGAVAGNRPNGISAWDSNAQSAQIRVAATGHLDSPATTAAITYKLQYYVASGTTFLNRTITDTDTDTYPRTSSNITAEEIYQ